MKKLTKAMAISLLASTVAISTVGCRYTVEVKDNEAPTKQEQQLQPTDNSKSENESTKTNKETTNKEAEKTTKEAEKTNKKAEKSSSHTTTKRESKKGEGDNEYAGDNYNKHICAICGKKLASDDAVFIGDSIRKGYGFAHGDCINNYNKEKGEGDWDDSPTEPEEPNTNIPDDGPHYSGDTSHDEPTPGYDEPDISSTYAE